jgi:serine/threonine-protein kinase
MSPEQLRRETLDGRSDIFSFGIVLYEMISGGIPFPGANAFDIAAAILKDEPKAIGVLPQNLPAEINPLTLRLLVKKRDGRLASFIDIKRELETIVELKRKLESVVHTKELRFESQTLTLEVAPFKDTGQEAVHDTLAPRGGLKAPPTVLVLPLEAVGGAEESAFIGIGLAHAITTKLARISGISVLSKTAGAGRIEPGRNTHEAARELGATILLEGEIMRAGNTVAVMARLINVETGRVIWGEQYRGDISEVFNIQDTVCESIVLALRVNVSSEARTSLARPATVNLDAFEFYSKGRAFLERHDVKENIDFAIQMFEQALNLDEDFAIAYAGLGEAYWEKYRATHERQWIERAITASDHALILDPSQSQVYVSLGIVYHGTGKIDQAIEQFERAIELQPLNDEALKWLGRCYQRKGDKEKAVAYFEKAIKIRPGYWHNYNLLGECYYIFGCYREAAEQFRRVITFQPDNSKGYDNLGSMYYLLGRYEDAVKMHKKATEIYADPLAFTNLGSDYFYLGRFDEAVHAYQAAINLSPRNDILYRNLGDAYIKLGARAEAEQQYQNAIQLLQERLRINAQDALAVGDLAVCYAKLNDDGRALANIERAIALEPHNTTIMYLQAVVFALTGRSDEAIEQLKHALDHGYSQAEAARDPDLDTLRDRENYRSLFPDPSL